MLSSERRSLIRFLLIYLGSTFVLFALASWIFYTSARKHLLDQQMEVLKYEATKLKSKLHALHQSDAKKHYYPLYEGVHSAIYDLDGRYIFGNYPKPPKLDKPAPDGSIYDIEKLEPYYLGAAYLLLSRKIDHAPIRNLQRNILLFMIGGGLFFSILGYFLGRLFIAPMRESIERMNHFIQDTTHELNTPISTILTNVEMIEALDKCEEGQEELKRIEIASKTLSRIYDDLTYLNLNHEYHRNIVKVDVSELVKERISYFETTAKAKNIEIRGEITPGIRLMIDRNDALRLVDNLLSNAIKYNRMGGKIAIVLDEKCFAIEDTGVGIDRRDLARITERFGRANKSEGGFGIGLDIVRQVVNNYGFELSIDSQTNRGTKVWVCWRK